MEEKPKYQPKIIVSVGQFIFNEALSNYLSSKTNYQVANHTTSFKELINEMKAGTPEIVLMDIKWPGADGWEIFRLLKNRFPSVKVIIFSLDNSDQTLSQLISEGANAFVSKTERMEVLLDVIQNIGISGNYFSKYQLDSVKRLSQNTLPEIENLFSDRERQVITEICNGHSNKLISQKLCITTSTVDFHKQRIYKKTNTSNVLDLFKFALKHRIITTD